MEEDRFELQGLVSREDKERCIKEFMADPYSGDRRRCEGKAGHGPYGIYCERCADMVRAAWEGLKEKNDE